MSGLFEIEARIRQVFSDYAESGFSQEMESTVKVFLDLALEYQGMEDFHRLVVLIPKVILGWEAALYLAGADGLAALSATTCPQLTAQCEAGEKIRRPLCSEPQQEGGDWFVPLQHNALPPETAGELNLNPVLGLLSILRCENLGAKEISFLFKYANLVAQSMVQRLLADRHRQHLNFIRKLVADIGHNVIVPNIFFKAYLRRLYGKIERLIEIQEQLYNLRQAPPQQLPSQLRELSAEMAYANEGLVEEFGHIQKHYVNTSLFLETLFRQSHFEQGRYVLQKTNCNLKRDVIGPQMDRFRPRLDERGIEVDLSAGGIPDQAIEGIFDVGLISQVYANFLSNAVKYTRPAGMGDRRRKFIAYGIEVIPNAFGPGEAGIKLNLFSTGPPLEPKDAGQVFNEGYRGSNIGKERGTGHGLFFVKEVVELHGGRVGYEPTEMGNNFFFILPK